MTAHDHREYVEGCFRCDLSREEVTDAQPLTARDLAVSTSDWPKHVTIDLDHFRAEGAKAERARIVALIEAERSRRNFTQYSPGDRGAIAALDRALLEQIAKGQGPPWAD